MNPDSALYGWGLPVAASTYAAKIDWTLYLMHVVMIGIFVIWGIFMVYCLVRYRRRQGVPAVYGNQHAWSSYVPDALILAFDIWLIFVVGIPIWAHIREELPPPENATVVNIIAQQFAWNIHYPGADGKFGKRDPLLIRPDNLIGLDEKDPDAKDDITSVNDLYIPIGKPVRVNLTSMDVIHSFFVPEFRTKQDAVPGMLFPIWFEPTMTGKFEIGCAQLCGIGHYRMRGNVIVQSQEEFDAWMKEKMKEKE